jgi:glycosyltransferase involved in cell wall biosynthesis
MNLAPRKLGSFEGWVEALCREARARGERLDVFGRLPAHPAFLSALREVGSEWRTVDALLHDPFKAAWTLSRYDVLHLNMFAPRSRLALLAYAAFPARVIFVDHTSDPRPSPSARPNSLRQWVDRATMTRVTRFAGVSDYVRDRGRARFALRDRARTIYNGVDPRRFSPRASPRAAGGEVLIATVAHLIPQKGVDHLLRALAQMRQRVRLQVIGDGPEAPRLGALAAELGIGERVQLLGLRDDVAEVLQAADVFVHPAIWSEAFGLTIAEAMAAGLPVVASRVGGIPELVTHGETGLLVPPGDAGALAGALDLLAADGQERARLGANARRRVLERFDLQTSVRAHLGLCEEAAASGWAAR